MVPTPMDVEHDFNWGVLRERRNNKCDYLTPLKKRRIEEVSSESVTPLHTQLTKYTRSNSEVVQKKRKEPFLANIATIPIVLIGYLHLVLNFVLIALICYAFIYILISVQRDIRHRITDRRTKIRQEISEAKGLYEINRCDPSSRVPAMEGLCNKWECVIKNGYGSIGYTRIIAEVFGDVIDGFVRKFSVRSSLVMGFFFTVFLVFRRSAKT